MELRLGQVVCDVHDGIDLSSIGNPKVVNKIVVPARNAGQMIQDTIQEQVEERYSYLNKTLVVCEEDMQGNLVLMCSYDSIRLIVVIVEFPE